ncbi:MAG TPA: hypothetical protein VMI52_13745 [Acetobacteraceae bacterium]|nr:hypothetical protein [Acetobacteraceae bacterium]
MQSILAWARQPTTVTGFSALCGTLVALLTHQVTLDTAAPLLVSGVLGMALPDNSAARSAAGALTADAVQVVKAVESARPQSAPQH